MHLAPTNHTTFPPVMALLNQTNCSNKQFLLFIFCLYPPFKRQFMFRNTYIFDKFCQCLDEEKALTVETLLLVSFFHRAGQWAEHVLFKFTGVDYLRQYQEESVSHMHVCLLFSPWPTSIISLIRKSVAFWFSVWQVGCFQVFKAVCCSLSGFVLQLIHCDVSQWFVQQKLCQFISLVCSGISKYLDLFIFINTGKA